MANEEREKQLLTAIQDWASTSEVDSEFLPKTEELAKALEAAVQDNESLQRYQEARERLGERRQQYTGFANFPYTIRAV